MKRNLCILTILLAGAWVANVYSQPIAVYSSGSTGADGPFAPQITSTLDGEILTGAPPGSKFVGGNIENVMMKFIDVPMPPSGIFNFTTINVPKNMRVRFIPNDTNSPVVMLATGDVSIAGEISVQNLDTSCAVAGLDSGKWTDGNTTMSRWIPGPGGYRGGKAPREPGVGPYAGTQGYGGSHGGFSLPLVGGSGGGYASFWGGYPGAGGAGVIYLASSTKIIFLSDTGVTRNGILFGGYYSGYGMAAVFANEIVGTPRSSDNGRMLVSACRQETITGMSIYPMWATGIVGNNIPINPSARFIQVGTNTIPENVTGADLFQVPAPGTYKVTVETRNIPPGVAFVISAARLNLDGSLIRRDEFALPPTITVGTTGSTTCQARGDVQIESGYQYLQALAKAPIMVASVPAFEGSPLKEIQIAIDREGHSSIEYLTASGTVLSHQAAMRLAVQQGKWEFIRKYSQASGRS